MRKALLIDGISQEQRDFVEDLCNNKHLTENEFYIHNVFMRAINTPNPCGDKFYTKVLLTMLNHRINQIRKKLGELFAQNPNNLDTMKAIVENGFDRIHSSFKLAMFFDNIKNEVTIIKNGFIKAIELRESGEKPDYSYKSNIPVTCDGIYTVNNAVGIFHMKNAVAARYINKIGGCVQRLKDGRTNISGKFEIESDIAIKIKSGVKI